MCITLVGVAHAVGHVQQGVKSVRRMAKRTLKRFKNVTAVLICTKREDVVNSRRPYAFFALLAVAPVYHACRSRRGLYRVVAAFTLSVFAPVFTSVF